MLGAIIGDIVGSRFEWRNHKSKEFEFFHEKCTPTDDSVMTLAVAEALIEVRRTGGDLREAVVRTMQDWGLSYPNAGYGGRFRSWLMSPDPRPYNSFGNGAAMRVSPCGFAATSAEEAKALAVAVTDVTHDHIQSLTAAQAVAETIYLARTGVDKEALRAHVTGNYYPLGFTLDEIRPGYRFDVSCQGSVPQAFEAFFESTDFEDAIRNAVSIGGDSDTIAAVAGSLAQAYYGVPDPLRTQALAYMDERQKACLNAFETAFPV